MEGIVQRLIAALVVVVIALLVAWASLTVFDLPLAVAIALALVAFVSVVVLAVAFTIRRDVRLLKTHALELTGYEAEINRRVDYLSTLVERSGGASVDEIAKRMRGLAHEFAALGERLERLETDRDTRARETTAARASVDREHRPSPAIKPRDVGGEQGEIAPPIGTSQEETALEGDHSATGIRKVIDARTHRATSRAGGSEVGSPARPGAAAAVRTRPDPLTAAELGKAIAGTALVFHLVPVLALPERRPDYYEAVQRLRLADATWLEPDELSALARKHGLHSLVERKTLYSAARMLRSVKAMGKHMRLFSQLSVDSLIDERGFKELRTFLEASSDLSEELILEVPQERFRGLASEARQRLALVVDAGFSLSLGDVRDPDVDVATLRQLGFRYARAQTRLLLNEPDPGGADSLALRLSTHRVALIAVGADEEEDVLALIDRDVAHAQGTALSPPRVVKDELLRGAAASRAPQRARMAS